ncbi:MAG: hypothetical protein EXQ88_07980 [Alphaproteobacteria bacterium]|nr:hypothetical protein [Alphaproteobacteria bacterium]
MKSVRARIYWLPPDRLAGVVLCGLLGACVLDPRPVAVAPPPVVIEQDPRPTPTPTRPAPRTPAPRAARPAAAARRSAAKIHARSGDVGRLGSRPGAPSLGCTRRTARIAPGDGLAVFRQRLHIRGVSLPRGTRRDAARARLRHSGIKPDRRCQTRLLLGNLERRGRLRCRAQELFWSMTTRCSSSR